MAERLKTIGIHFTRYGLVIVLLWRSDFLVEVEIVAAKE
jgi:hypothetical protein